MKKLFAFFLALVMCFVFTACGGEETTPADTNAPATNNPAVSNPGDGSWAVYWYLCGSDLETNYGCATTDLQEMLEIKLPENVNVVIQTGGTNVWQNEQMDASKLQRWLYNSEGLQLIHEEAAGTDLRSRFPALRALRYGWYRLQSW